MKNKVVNESRMNCTINNHQNTKIYRGSKIPFSQKMKVFLEFPADCLIMKDLQSCDTSIDFQSLNMVVHKEKETMDVHKEKDTSIMVHDGNFQTLDSKEEFLVLETLNHGSFFCRRHCHKKSSCSCS